jgi:O-antigen ligase
MTTPAFQASPSGRPTTPLLAPTLALLLVAIGGSYTLDRAGLSALAWLDLRVVGLAVALPLVWLDVRQVRRLPADRRRPEGWLVAAMVFFLFQIASAAWAPPGARVGADALDIICMGLLTVALYLHARQNPRVVARRLLWFLWGTGVVFGLGALLLTGAGAQGRFAAFGGGPNVFVRIEMLAMLAVAALVITGARRALLWSVPLFGVCAVLSGSRGGLVAGILVGLAAALVGGRRARRIALTAMVGVCASVAVAYVVSPTVANVIQTRFVQQTTQQGYDSSRRTVWRQAAELATQHPLAGSGLDGFYALIGTTTGIEYPHNYVLAVAAEGGVLGLALFSITLALWVRTIRTAPLRDVETAALVAAAAYIAVASLFSGNYYDSRLAWCCAAVAAAMVVHGRQAAEPDPVLSDSAAVR